MNVACSWQFLLPGAACVEEWERAAESLMEALMNIEGLDSSLSDVAVSLDGVAGQVDISVIVDRSTYEASVDASFLITRQAMAAVEPLCDGWQPVEFTAHLMQPA